MRSRIIWLALAGLVVGLILIGIAGATWFPAVGIGNVTLALVVEEFGRAGVLGSLLTLTIDGYIRSKGVEKLTRDVAAGVEAFYLTYSLPPEFADEVHYIKDIRFHRKDYEIRVWFRQPDGGSPDELHFEAGVSYYLVNYMREALPYTFRMAVEKGGPPDRPNKVTWASGTGADILDGHEFAERVNETAFKRKVLISPNERDPQARFEGRVSKVVPANYGSEPVVLTEPILNLRVRIEEKPDDLDVTVNIGHRQHQQRTVAIPPEKPHEWRLSGAFLPWSGVYLEWQRNGDDPQALLAVPDDAPDDETPAVEESADDAEGDRQALTAHGEVPEVDSKPQAVSTDDPTQGAVEEDEV